MTLSNFTFYGVGFLLATTLVVTPASTVLAERTEESSSTQCEISTNTINRPKQETLTLAYSIAKRDNHKFPLLLPAIILQETAAGTVPSYKVAGHEFGLPPNKRYYGLAQVKLTTAKDVLRAFPKVRNEFGFHTGTDEEIIAKLIENDYFNLSIASKYITLLMRYGYTTLEQLALAYNQGPGGATRFDPSTHYYPRAIQGHVRKLNFR